MALRVWLRAGGLLALQAAAAGHALDEVDGEALPLLFGGLLCRRAARWRRALLSTSALWLSATLVMRSSFAPSLPLPGWLWCCAGSALLFAEGALSVAVVDLSVVRAVLRSGGFVGVALSLAQGVRSFGNPEGALPRRFM